MTHIPDAGVDATHAVLKHNLSHLLPIRVVIRTTSDGKIEGLTENSFSMDWNPTRVNIFWSGKAYSIIGEHIVDGIRDAEHNAKPGDRVIDPLADDSPIDIDWDKWKTATNKYDKRNVPFTMRKQNETTET